MSLIDNSWLQLGHFLRIILWGGGRGRVRGRPRFLTGLSSVMDLGTGEVDGGFIFRRDLAEGVMTTLIGFGEEGEGVKSSSSEKLSGRKSGSSSFS